jgi:hypothetical protein
MNTISGQNGLFLPGVYESKIQKKLRAQKMALQHLKIEMFSDKAR